MSTSAANYLLRHPLNFLTPNIKLSVDRHVFAMLAIPAISRIMSQIGSSYLTQVDGIASRCDDSATCGWPSGVSLQLIQPGSPLGMSSSTLALVRSGICAG